MLVTNDFEPDQRVRKEARSLTEKGMHVSVICLNRLAHYPIGHRRVDGVDVYSVAVGSFIAGKALSYLRALMCFYKKAWRLAIATHTTRPITVIHCHDFDTCLLGWALKHACSVPMIYDIHDWYPSYFAAKSVRRFVTGINTWFCRVSDALILVNEDFSKLPGVSRAKSASVVMNTPNMSGHGICELRDIGLFYSGNLDALRDMRYAIDVFRECGLPVELAGDGPLLQDYQRVVKGSHISLPGRITPEEVTRRTQQCYAVLALYDTSHINNRLATPNKVFEAMKYGKPSIVSAGTVMAEIVETLNCGLAVEYGNPSALSDAIEKLKSPKTYQQYCENGHRAFLRSYNWQVMESRLLTLYDQLRPDSASTPSATPP